MTLLQKLKHIEWNSAINSGLLFSNERFKYRRKHLQCFVDRHRENLERDFVFQSCFRSRPFRVRGAVRSPWWSRQTDQLAAVSWTPDATNRLPDPSPIDGLSNSWFEASTVHRRNVSEIESSPPISKYCTNAKYVLGNKELVRTVKCELKPEPSQKIVFEKAVRAYNVTRSSCIRWISKRKAVAIELVKQKNAINPLFDRLRSLFVINTPRGNNRPNQYFNDKTWLLEVSKEIRVSAVKDVVANLKSCLSNVEHGHQRKFVLKLKLKAVHCSFGVEKKLVCDRERNTVEFKFDKLFRQNKCSKIVSCVPNQMLKDGPPDADCRVHRDREGRYFLLLAYKIEKRDEIFDERPVVAGDMGVRKFITTYSTDGECHILGQACGVRVKRLLDERAKIQSVMADKKTSPRQLAKLKNSFRNKGRKIVNLRDELHRKLINWLTTNYSVIILPKLRSRQLVSKETSILGRKTKSVIMALAIDRFYQRLTAKCEVKHVLLINGDECYTTKGCDMCGKIVDVGSSEIFKCSECDRHVDRDVHSARNIYLKNTRIYAAKH